MDFALMSTLIPSVQSRIPRILVSYDIACQGQKNLQARLDSYNTFPPLDLSTLTYWKAIVPKFHLHRHGQDCQLSYNLAYMKWASWVDSEHIESRWAQTNPMATWTWVSGPNACWATLDDHWNAGNWQKSLQLHKSFIILPAMYNLTLP